jgi:hypothetical protein
MSKSFENSLLPGLESERVKGIRRKSFFLAAIFSTVLFGLLPLSEFAKNEQWLVRDAIVPAIPPPLLLRQRKSKKLSKKSNRIRSNYLNLPDHPLPSIQVLWIFRWMYPQAIFRLPLL